MTKPGLYSVETVKALIEQGKHLHLAGDEGALRALPRGSWIGGTIPYFMAEGGGVCTQDQIFVHELPAATERVEIVVYDADTVSKVYQDAPERGLSLIIVTASSPTHLSFSLNAPKFPDFATRPLVGWIAGGVVGAPAPPKVFDGQRGEALEDGAVVMHVQLPTSKVVDINILSIFEPGDGDTLVFPEDGFVVRDVSVNGETVLFADYLDEKGIDIRLPVVADLYGAIINTSFRHIDEQRNVHFYAPVFGGLRYTVAKPVGDYVETFSKRIPEGVGDNIFFSCNCILNYLYAELEGKVTAPFVGPITFGEIAYQLVNQTLAYATIEDLAPTDS